MTHQGNPWLGNICCWTIVFVATQLSHDPLGQLYEDKLVWSCRVIWFTNSWATFCKITWVFCCHKRLANSVMAHYDPLGKTFVLKYGFSLLIFAIAFEPTQEGECSFVNKPTQPNLINYEATKDKIRKETLGRRNEFDKQPMTQCNRTSKVYFFVSVTQHTWACWIAGGFQ